VGRKTMKIDFENICIVLVEPKNPGNIGSVARAMKNMGIPHLRLVKPVEYRDSEEQRKLGYRSQEIIKNSREFESLKTALNDISCAFLATTRKGKWKKDFLHPGRAAEIMMDRKSKERIALIFGREDSGVTIDESQLANYYIRIPTAVDYPSLNLAQSVMVMVYEIFMQSGANREKIELPKRAEQKKYERLYDNIWSLMKSLEFREEDKGLFHRSLRRALNRTRWTNADIAVFDRACKQVRWYIESHLGDKSVD
jgi:tRNA/rRNA methyltransferase